MFTSKFSKTLAIVATSAMFGLSTLQSAQAAPGTLSRAPLFLSAIVEPNVWFTLDDSGSMAWVTMVEEGTGGFSTFTGMPLLDGDRLGYWHPSWSEALKPYAKTVPPSEVPLSLRPSTWAAENGENQWDDTWIFRTHQGNTLYYNPAKTYSPWPGSKADGTPMYVDAVETAVLQDPNNPTGNKVNLTQRFNYGGYNGAVYLPTYYIWNDDGDGVLETTDGHTLVEITAGTAEMQNFANWFQYHRSRMNTTKAAIGQVINNTDSSRMGLSVFNKTSMQAYSKSMSDTTNKRLLLEKFYGVAEETYTPARAALDRVGQHFMSTGTNAPILPATLGGECQQNFNILMTDGFWNRSFSGTGHRDRDGDSGVNNSPFDGNAGQSNDGGNYADAYSNTLADVAMEYYETDLRTDLADRVPVTVQPSDPTAAVADHQHLVNYSVAFGLKGTLDPLIHDPESTDPAKWPATGWPQPVGDTLTTVDDLWHAAYNSRGLYLNAKDPQQLTDSLDAAIADIADRTATAAAVSINSAKLTTQAVVYLAQFNTNRWQGDIQAFQIDDPATGALKSTYNWSAQTKLNNRFPLNTSIPVGDPSRPENLRTVVTYNGTSGTPFRWANLTTAQRNDLKTNPSGGTDSDTIAQARLGYLRGDRDNEATGQSFRERLSMLGDIVHAGPVFVGAPDLNWPDKAPFGTAAQRYSDFKNGSAKSRAGVVYTGSNYGMLHGFAESTGEEVLAYIPSVLFSTTADDGMHYLTDPNYQHRYYVDLTPTLSDVYADLGSGAKWQTILVGGLRGGGRGIFALNVNDPVQFTEANANKIALWEFTNADDSDLGHTFSRPVIGMANNNRWVAVFGNGYNDTGSGEAKLFIVDIVGGLDGDWTDPGDVIEITTSSGNTTTRNGLSSPALADLDGNGTIDVVYAGDLFGQMWKFDLSGSTTGDWTTAGAQKLFTTINGEPITGKPSLAKHPTIADDGSNDPNVMVFFGTGQYLTNADKTSTDTNYFYGVWDKGVYNRVSTHLSQQTYLSGFTDPNGNPARVLSQNTVNYSGGQYGWYFVLPDSGERVVETSVVRGNLVFFNTFAPNSDPCSVGGYGYRMAVDIINGGSPDDASFDVNNDGIINASDKATNGGVAAVLAGIRQDGYLPEPVFIEDIAYTAETPTKVVKLKKIPTGRFSWQELIQ